MLYKVEHGKDVFELNPELKAVEEYARLTSRQMVYVILSTDYKGPFRRLSAEKRKIQAAVTAGYKYEKDGKRLDANGRSLVEGKVGNVEAAIKKYMESREDEDYEALLSISTLIAQIRDFNNKPDKTAAELKLAVEMNVGKMDKLIETKKKIEEIIDMREEEVAHVDENGNKVGQNDIEEEINVDKLSILAKINEGIL